MLILIGLGIEQSPTMMALEQMKECDAVFFESYTSPMVKRKESFFETVGAATNLGNTIRSVSREFVEDGRKILDLARGGKVSLVCSGDPLVATTHQELRTRALREGIETRVIHGSSILCAVAGELGLHSYNFGRTVTMTEEPMQYTAYNTIYGNLLRGLHTTILLQWDESRGFFLSPASAVKSLEHAENDLKYGILNEKTLVLVASRLGTPKPSLVACTADEVSSLDLGEPPHVVVIPGKLHFTEIDALSVVTSRDPSSIRDNSEGIQKLSRRMLDKYSKKTLAALQRAKDAAKAVTSSGSARQGPRFDEIFENVECYTQDAIRFLNEGKEELAVLSIGYAEGLLDALRFGGMLEFEW